MKKIPFILTTILCLGAFGFTDMVAAGTGARQKRLAVRKAALQKRHQDTIRHLNLSPEQKKRIRAFRAEHHKRVATLNAQIHVKRVELEDEMAKPNPDQERMKQLTQEIGQLKASRDLERLKAKRELEKILTPGQNEELKRIEKEALSDEPAEDEAPGR